MPCLFESGAPSVIISDINKAQSAGLATQLPSATAIECDVTSEQSVREMFASIDRLDILVNNAGIGLVGGVGGDKELSDFERVMRVNVEGVSWSSRTRPSRN